MASAYRTVDETVTDEDGVVLKSSHTEVSFRMSEPAFVKLYLRDIAKLNELPNSGSGVMYELVYRIGYDNRVTLNASVKKQIATKLGFKSYRQVDNAIQVLKKKGIFTAPEPGILMANPDMFGKGKWEDINQLRTTITYTEEGRFIVTDIKKDERKSALKAAENKILEEAQNIIASTILPVNPKKLIAFLSNPENQTATLSITTITCWLSTTMYCMYTISLSLLA